MNIYNRNMATKCNTNSGIRASCYVKQSRNVFERVTSASSARRNAWKDNRLETYGQKYLRGTSSVETRSRWNGPERNGRSKIESTCRGTRKVSKKGGADEDDGRVMGSDWPRISCIQPDIELASSPIIRVRFRQGLAATWRDNSTGQVSGHRRFHFRRKHHGNHGSHNDHNRITPLKLAGFGVPGRRDLNFAIDPDTFTRNDGCRTRFRNYCDFCQRIKRLFMGFLVRHGRVRCSLAVRFTTRS